MRHEPLYDLHDQYDNVPDRTIEGLRKYVEEGIPPGHFMEAVLENNLRKALANADSHNLAAIKEIGLLVWNKCPMACWGTRRDVEHWVEEGGLG